MSARDAEKQPSPPQPGVDPRLLEILVCPVTKGRLRYDATRQELVSERARLAFPIRDGVPLMCVEAARSLDESDRTA